MFTQIVYSSYATRAFNEGELAEILASSVKGNARRDITGLLLYTKGTFLQVLEGKADDIDEVLEIIKADPRHHRFDLLLRHPVKSRDFSQWNMGFRRIQEGEAATLPNFAPFFEDGFDPEKIKAKSGLCLRILKALAELPSTDPD